MASEGITTEHGTTVSLKEDPANGTLVILDNPAAPDNMRHCEAGRIVEGFGFQPAPFAAWALRADVLRAIASLIEDKGGR